MQHLESHFQSRGEVRRAPALHVGHSSLQLLPIIRRRANHLPVVATDEGLRDFVENHNVHKVIVAQRVQDGVHRRHHEAMRPSTHRLGAIQEDKLQRFASYLQKCTKTKIPLTYYVLGRRNGLNEPVLAAEVVYLLVGSEALRWPGRARKPPQQSRGGAKVLPRQRRIPFDVVRKKRIQVGRPPEGGLQICRGGSHRVTAN